MSGMIKKEHAGGRNKIKNMPFFHVSEDCLIVARLHKSAYFS